MFKQIKNVLAIASQVILSASVTLPGRVLEIARYVALAIGLLDAVENQVEEHKDNPDEDQPSA